MSERRNFPAKVKLAAFERSKGLCEGCGAKLFPGNIHYDHIIPDAIGGEPTIENCSAKCRACHRNKTSADDMPRIAKAKRNQRKNHAGIRGERTIRAWRKFSGQIVIAPRER